MKADYQIHIVRKSWFAFQAAPKVDSSMTLARKPQCKTLSNPNLAPKQLRTDANACQSTEHARGSIGLA